MTSLLISNDVACHLEHLVVGLFGEDGLGVGDLFEDGIEFVAETNERGDARVFSSEALHLDVIGDDVGLGHLGFEVGLSLGRGL